MRLRRLLLILALLAVAAVALLQWYLRRAPAVLPGSQLERIRHDGRLRVLTVYGATTYYPVADGGFAGFEYDLVRRFGQWLGVEVAFVAADSVAELLAAMLAGKADMAAAGLTVTEVRRQYLRFSEPYQYVSEQVIYRRGAAPRPRRIADLEDRFIEVMLGSSHASRLARLRRSHRALRWRESDATSEEILRRVDVGLTDYTVMDSNRFRVLQRFYPSLQVGFDLTESVPLAWAFNPEEDDSLRQAANRFLAQARRDRTLESLLEQYYGHVDVLEFLDVCTFQRHVRQRLSQYLPWFREAGEKYGWDWRLLAAIAYQESHWNVNARSPTGVAGLMMLTRDTARQLGIRNRRDPKESIFGAARYLNRLKAKIPERIPEPDRTWFTLAAYNVGFGHLEDARILTQQAGEDPDRWMDVKKYLPKLAQKRWYSRVKRGYARGWEPVRYVENIRNYYDLLLPLDNPALSAGRRRTFAAVPRIPRPAPPPSPSPGG
ncbi:membrane-bound lytic murein transglycosylase F [Methylomarinovum caldicuralii]|uniref:Membrane-bound lytic murein transglycosylase F n=1 Tax=Methylomarinovum caldicuralii TaxID=438856 RepID=A0AAU9CSY0_9GAMM|nr:membrane-bound lytic murein transglycosylase MltF [Methylomarinovum caldicuralii]BCX81022.1 membrane-bound lytic murein transglycosylase F [Methylomarinovum caldicuralii]